MTADPETPPASAGERPAGTERRLAQLLALNSAAIAITGELELDRLLQRIVDVARELVGCKYAALGVLGEDGFIARFPTSGVSETDREKIGNPPRGHGLLGVMLRAGRSLRVPDMSADPRRVGFPPNHPAMTSLLGVPIFVRGKLVGDLYLTDKLGGPEFDEEDEWLVQLLATHAATALTNAQLHAENLAALDEAGSERARVQALLNAAQAVNRSVHLDLVIPGILRSAVDLLGASGAAVYLLPEEANGGANLTDDLYLSATFSVGLRAPLGAGTRLPVGKSIAGRALRSGLTQVVQDASAERGIILPLLPHASNIRSLVVVPLYVSDHLLGTLSIYADKTNSWDDEAVALIEAFAAHASAALYNAQLYEQAEHGRRAAEREQQRLREVEQMKAEFLSTAAHELRTPLTSIRMSAGLAHEQIKHMAALDELDPRLVSLLGLVVESAERMQSLVNDLLDLTRLEQGTATMTVEEVDLRDVVRASVKETAPLFESKGQMLAVHLPEVYCGVLGDPARLEQVVINLLSNAHKYSQQGSRIEIRCLRTASDVQVSVRDNGPGVPEEERELIFQRFYRSSMHRQDRTPSTGLGLPIARTISELHRGRLWVESAPGGGSLFVMSVPLASG